MEYGSEQYSDSIYKKYAAKINVSFKNWKDLRRLCQTDLFSLAETLQLDIVESPHREMCKFFVQKNPDKPFEEQDEIKERQMLISRGTFKSSLLVADEAQWIINFPGITILKLTAEETLATKFVGLLKRWFTFPEDGQWSDFQVLFPEFCIEPEQHGKEHEFTTPARALLKESSTVTSATIWASSITSNLPGFHPWILELDDAVNNKNSATDQLKRKVIENIDYADYLLNPGGYKTAVGTPYATDDYYSVMRERAIPGELKFIIKPAWTVKPQATGKQLEDLTEEDVTLLFPSDKRGKPRLTFKHLKKELRKNRAIFCSQNLCAPEIASVTSFTMDLLQSRTISLKQVPTSLTYYVTWDFAYGQKAHNDYSGCAIGAIDDQGRLYVIDAFKAKYTDWALACKIVDVTKQYSPYMTLIEDSLGAHFLSDAIMRRAAEVGVEPRIEWFTVDHTKGAKDIRVYSLESLLQQSRMFFVSDTIANTEEVHKSFIKYSSTTKNDLPDAISHLQRAVPKQIQAPQDLAARARIMEDLREREMERIIFEGPQEEIQLELPQPTVEEESGMIFDFGGGA
jgi:phage terminase large subunit-like protein